MTLRDRGTERNVFIENLPALDGKSITDPTFSAAGVTAQVESASTGSLGLKLHFTGKPLAIGDIELLDSSTNNVILGESGVTLLMGDEKNFSYQLTSPLSASMKLKIQVLVGQKDQVVAFDLHDIPLP